MSQNDAESTDTDGAAAAAVDEEARELDRKVAEHLRYGLPLATLVCAVVAGVYQGPSAVILVLAAGALVSVIAIFWASVRPLVGETALSGADAYALGAPRAEEEQKRAVLRALKDLEFERAVGKISDADYQELVTRYRAEAKRLLRLLDEESGPNQRKVEELVLERLLEEGLAELDGYRVPPTETKLPKNKKKARGGKDRGAAPPKEPAKDEAAKAKEPAKDEALPEQPPAPASRPACASCGTRNDADAVFCKKCGARQRPEDDERESEDVDEGEDEREEKEAP